MMGKIKQKYPKLHKDVNFNSSKEVVQKWINQFIETDYQNRFITWQTIEVFSRAKKVNINIPSQYQHLVNESLIKDKTAKHKSSLQGAKV
jgi:hypothetical protein